MNNVIFARPRWNYDSYTDLYRLIALSGFPMIYFDEIDPQSNNTYIMTIVNGENQNGWKKAGARIILWDLEWRLEGDYPNIPGVSETWASDRWYADTINAKYVPMGSHPDLPNKPLEDCPRQWHVAMLSYMTNRRTHMANILKRSQVRISPQGWGDERHDILQQTHIMLCVHQRDEAPTIAPQRWALAAAYKLPMICESVHDTGVFEGYGLFADYDDIPDTIDEGFAKPQQLSRYAEQLHELLCKKMTFRKCVEAAL